uniref:Uncharacterized protein n=1 Tax=Myoviridae sp. ctnjE18 TaxID=2827706 RepID=A0A8S5STS3_9CAUD|nr:MAG TPA: hypothetical protein [Myoviridae sp. ctnjE18]
MGREIVVKVPDAADDAWLREQIESLRVRIEAVVEVEDNEESFNKLGACLDIIDALQQYTGY